MTTAELLQGVLSGLASGGAWAIRARDSAPLPYIVYAIAGNPINNSFEGPSDGQQSRIQVDCYASTYEGVKVVELAVIGVLGSRIATIGSPVAWSSMQDNQIDLYDSDLKAYRSLLEFSLWRV